MWKHRSETHVFLELVPGVTLAAVPRVVVLLEGGVGTVSEHTLNLHTMSHHMVTVQLTIMRCIQATGQ